MDLEESREFLRIFVVIISIITIFSAITNIFITLVVKRLRQNKLFFVILFMSMAGTGSEILKILGIMAPEALQKHQLICAIQAIM
jgi:hypothetical protein